MKCNLLDEGISDPSSFVVGNTAKYNIRKKATIRQYQPARRHCPYSP